MKDAHEIEVEPGCFGIAVIIMIVVALVGISGAVGKVAVALDNIARVESGK